MKLLVLAAGYATRLKPLTDKTAKPLLPVASRPMIDHVLGKFADSSAIDQIFVVTNHRYADDFRAWAAEHGGSFGQKPLVVVDDGTTSNDDRLGAIGDMDFVIRTSHIDDDLIVVAGDNLFSDSLSGFVEQAQKRGVLVGVYDVGSLVEIRKYNNLGLDEEGRITHFEEKPVSPTSTLTAIALYHYPRAVVPKVAAYLASGGNPDQPGRFVQWLYPQLPCFTYRVHGIWLDIGSHETYDEAQRLFRSS